MADITVVGNLTADPELRFTPSGAAVASFTVAENRRKRNATTGEYEDAGTTFYRCSAFQGLAENICESLEKGHRVIVKGDFHTRSYDRPDGSTGLSVEILVRAVGPDLTFATAKPVRIGRAYPDAGSSAGRGEPAAAASARTPSLSSTVPADEPPF